MIVARARGGLGNQLFYLSILERWKAPKEVVVVSGLNDIDQDFLSSIPGFVCLTLRKRAANLSQILMEFFVELRLIGFVQMSPDEQSLVRHRGLLSIYWLKPESYQREALVDVEIIERFRSHVTPSLASPSLPILGGDLADTAARSSPQCFVHVRRGDYRDFPSREFSAMLSLSWYSEQMTTIAQEFPTTRFLVFSDETDVCKSFFDRIRDVTVVDCGPVEAFLGMSMCDSGVLSPSSLSWWAAKLASQKSTDPSSPLATGFGLGTRSGWTRLYGTHGSSCLRKVISRELGGLSFPH